MKRRVNLDDTSAATAKVLRQVQHSIAETSVSVRRAESAVASTRELLRRLSRTRAERSGEIDRFSADRNR